MKVGMILMDAIALDVVLRCARCRARVTVQPVDWTPADLDACPTCGARWADDESAEVAWRALIALRNLVRADAAQLPFEVQFGAARVIRDAA